MGENGKREVGNSENGHIFFSVLLKTEKNGKRKQRKKKINSTPRSAEMGAAHSSVSSKVVPYL